MKNFKSGFTMVELIFVIVILGILAAVAVPKLSITRDDAQISKMRADVAAIKSGINLERGKDLMVGTIAWPDPGTNFDAFIQNGLPSGNDRNGWTMNGTHKAKACVAGSCTTFTYYQTASEDGKNKAGTFSCNSSDEICKTLSN
ncbi:MAG: prepilin-type N-terminal cleavage/methylation domain-containing protein [Campylobacter sp.]|nr:prepilin-type N-terminal cleavage/methylation domain-containing protein [Campylobacter sp.]